MYFSVRSVFASESVFSCSSWFADTSAEEEFEKLQAEQRIWIEEKEKTIEEAGKEVKGGSIYSLVVNSEAAKITEERVYELYELLKE